MHIILLITTFMLFQATAIRAHTGTSMKNRALLTALIQKKIDEYIASGQAGSKAIERAQQNESKAAQEALNSASNPVDAIHFGFSQLIQSPSQDVLFLGAQNVLGAQQRNYSLSRAILNQDTSPAQVDLQGLSAGSPLEGETLTNLSLLTAPGVIPVPIMSIDAQPFIYLIPNPLAVAPTITTSPLLKDAAGVPSTSGPRAIAGGARKNSNNVFTGNGSLFAIVQGTGAGIAFESTALSIANANNRGLISFNVSPDAKTVTENASDNANKQATQLKQTAISDAAATRATIHTAFFGATQLANTNGPVAGALFGNNVALHWDETLQRLYIGLEHAKRNDDTREGGVMALLSARFNGPNETLVIEPVIANMTRDHFYINSANVNKKNVIDAIVGFYSNGVATGVIQASNNGDLPLELSAHRIKSMHTSTGKTYLIVQGSGPAQLLNAGDTNSLYGVFALPLLGETYSNGTAVLQAQRGTLAKKDFSGPVQNLDDLGRVLQEDVCVGRIQEDGINSSTNKIVPHPDTVTDLFVEGDAVYICMKGNTTNQMGIFRSSALFDADGNIQSWTPWARAAGSAERVFTGARSHANGNYYFVGEQALFNHASNTLTPAGDGDVVKIAHWGRTENNLSTVLAQLFPASQGGVYQLCDFHEATLSFNPQRISFIVALGDKKVALIKTGTYDNITDNFYPVTTYNTDGASQNIWVFEDPALQEIGPLCCAAISFAPRIPSQPNGFLFVGGYKGAAVLTNNLGLGFQPPLNDLASGAYPDPSPGANAGFSFKKVVLAGVPALENVRAILATGVGMTIAASNALYTVPLNNGGAAQIFDGATPVGPSQISIPSPAGVISDALFIWNGLLGLVPPARAMLVVGTSRGLFVSHNNGGSWQEIPLNGVTGQPIMQLAYLSNQQAYTGPRGNLFVLAADRAVVPAETTVYRFAVNLDDYSATPDLLPKRLLPVMTTRRNNGLLMDLGEFRGALFTDGTVALNVRGLHFGDTRLLNNTPIISPSQTVPLSPQLDIIAETNYNIGVPILESTSGTMMIPGDWGIRVNA